MNRLTARACLLVLVFKAFAQPTAQAHGPQSQPAGSDVLTGSLIDATWFTPIDRDGAADRAKRAAVNLGAGIPAMILPDGSEHLPNAWYLLTNPASLAPYAGKRIKVEGLRIEENHAIIPATISVEDGEKWREIQLPAAPETTGSAHEKTQEEESKHSERIHVGNAGRQHEHPPSASTKPAAALRDGTPSHEHAGHEHPDILRLPPWHPLLVNFTAALFPAAVLSDWLAQWLRRRSLAIASWWMLVYAALITPLTAVAGWEWFRQVGDIGHPQMAVHPALGTTLAVLLPLLAVWRGRSHLRSIDPSRIYLWTATVVLLALIVQGHLGATMSFPLHDQQLNSAGGYAH